MKKLYFSILHLVILLCCVSLSALSAQPTTSVACANPVDNYEELIAASELENAFIAIREIFVPEQGYIYIFERCPFSNISLPPVNYDFSDHAVFDCQGNFLCRAFDEECFNITGIDVFALVEESQIVYINDAGCFPADRSCNSTLNAEIRLDIDGTTPYIGYFYPSVYDPINLQEYAIEPFANQAIDINFTFTGNISSTNPNALEIQLTCLATDDITPPDPILFPGSEPTVIDSIGFTNDLPYCANESFQVPTPISDNNCSFGSFDVSNSAVTIEINRDFITFTPQNAVTVTYTTENLNCPDGTAQDGNTWVFNFFPNPICTSEPVDPMEEVDQVITICQGESVTLEGWHNTVECPCGAATQGPVDCFPFAQPGGVWTIDDVRICEGSCIDIEVQPLATTLYTHRTPIFSCPPVFDPNAPLGPPPPVFPAGPTLNILVVVEENCGDGNVGEELPTAPIVDGLEAEAFVAFPWLRQKMDLVDCSTASVIVYENGAYEFVYVQQGDSGTLYFEDGTFYCNQTPSYNCIEAYNLEAIKNRWTCTANSNAPVENCAENTGTIVFELCDDGRTFFFARTDDGQLLDIYFADNIDFNYYEGQSVSFNYESTGFDSPCSLADAAVLITCIEELTTTPPNEADIFESFPWVTDIVNERNCSSESISVYRQGAYAYLYIVTANSAALYFEDGTLYCTDAPNYDCLQGYGFTGNPTARWTCNPTTLPCECANIELPVCGSDGKTYGSPCEAACAGAEVVQFGPCEDCVCTEEFNPVCGVDGVTYENPCKARCAGMEILQEGVCVPNCACDTDYVPVCGVDGKTYGNACEAACAGVEIAGEGECESDCICTDEYDPVCGVDGKTYSNACQAACEGVEILFNGECFIDCICTAQYDPVCGVDGKTYGNACEAACAGVEVAAKGECSISCSLLEVIDLPENLCENCLSEIAVYTYQGSSYLATIADNTMCADGLTTVTSCETGATFCMDGGIIGFNQCEQFFLEAVKVESIAKENCGDCICPAVALPVCGADGRTYNNECEAACAGVEVLYDGLCADALAPPCADLASVDFGDCRAVMGVAIRNGSCMTISGCMNFVVNGIDYSQAFFPSVEICEQTCSGSTGSSVFTDYPWLERIISPMNCKDKKVTIYEQGAYQYIYVETGNGSTLYFEDGQFYCPDSPGMDCRAAYELIDVVTTWTCGERNSASSQCENPLNQRWLRSALASECTGDVYSFEYDGAPAIYISTLCACVDDSDRIFTCDGEFICAFGRIAPENRCEINPADLLIEANLIWSPECDCDCPAFKESVCGVDGNTYESACEAECAGIEVISCTDALAPPCMDLAEVDFGLCEAIMGVAIVKGKCTFVSGCLNFVIDGIDYSQAFFPSVTVCQQTCEETTSNENEASEEFFDTFPWLSDVLGFPNCGNKVISEFFLETYKYVYIFDPLTGLGTLYYQDGTFYCQDAPNYNCLTAYNLSPEQITLSWSCTDGNIYDGEEIATERSKEQASYFQDALTVFPNPTQGQFQVKIDERAKGPKQLSIFDLYGRLIQQQEVTTDITTVSIDLSMEENGVYMVRLQASGQAVVQKTIVKIGL